MALRPPNECSSNPDDFCSKELIDSNHSREFVSITKNDEGKTKENHYNVENGKRFTSNRDLLNCRCENGAKPGTNNLNSKLEVKYSPLASSDQDDCTKFASSNRSESDKSVNLYDNRIFEDFYETDNEKTDDKNLLDDITKVVKLQKLFSQSEISIVTEPNTASASCLKVSNKPSTCTVRVQFKTPYKETTSHINSNGHTSVNITKENVSPPLNDSWNTSNLKKNKKKKLRNPSGSSIISDCSKSSIVTNDSKTAEFERQALDGGWGWVVVFASFMVHCIADGVTMSFGILYVELLDTFGESKSITSWVGSLFMAIPLLAGPLASYATDVYGCRVVTIWGAIISCLGFLLSAYANSIVMLLFTIGLIAGLGLAACYVAAIVIVAFYFEKLRSLATGIAVAGSGIGTFLFAPIIQYLLKHYGWSGCMILLAGIFLNMAVFGALMRDLEWKKQKPRKTADNNLTLNSELDSMVQSSVTIDDVMPNNSSTIPSLVELKRLVQSGDIESVMFQDEPVRDIPRSTSLVILPTFMEKPEVSSGDLIANLSLKRNNFEALLKNYPHLISNYSLTKSSNYNGISTWDRCLLCQNNKINSFCIDHYEEQVTRHLKTTKENPSSVELPELKEIDCKEDTRVEAKLKPKSMTEKLATSWVDTSQKHWPVSPFTNRYYRRQSMLYRGAIVDILRYRLRSTSCPNISRSLRVSALEVEKKEVLREMITNCANISYCMDSSYAIFASSNFILYVFYDTVYMYLTDYAQEIGIPPDESANLISVIGILNCIGMVFMGYIGDKTWCSPLLIYNASMVACGLSVIAMPFIVNYWLLATASAIFGLFISANYALTAVILVEMISLEAFGKSYGVLLLIQGIANLVGPPLVGYMSDATGNYVIPFVISGIFIIICGLMLSLIPVLNRHKLRSLQADADRSSI